MEMLTSIKLLNDEKESSKYTKWISAESVLWKLSPQQRRALALLSFGCQNKEIAAALNVKEATVKAYITAALKLFGCNNRTQLALLALCLRHKIVAAEASQIWPPQCGDRQQSHAEAFRG